MSVHESIHNWFYGVLATNESEYPWMDEGFTEYASSEVMRHLQGGEGDPHADAYAGYLMLADSSAHEPMSVHADHFETNFGYGVTAYSKGEMFLAQLRSGHRGAGRRPGACCAISPTARFKHPEPMDLERVMEKQSGVELDWYFDEWINTTRLLDYAVDSSVQLGDSTAIHLRAGAACSCRWMWRSLREDGAKRIFTFPSRSCWVPRPRVRNRSRSL